MNESRLKIPAILLSVLIVTISFTGVSDLNLSSEPIQTSLETGVRPMESNIQLADLTYSPLIVEVDQRGYLSSAARSGSQDVAVICAHFNSDPTTRWSTLEIEGIMDTISDFWSDMSYQTVSINHQVEGWYELPQTLVQYGDLMTAWDEVIDDAIQLADANIDFSQFDYIMVWINTWWRGISTIGDWYQIGSPETSDGTFNVGATLVGERNPEAESAVWGRAAHEMGHFFGLRHTHPNYNSDYSLMARGYPSDLNVYSQSIDGATGWFDTSLNQMVIQSGGQGEYVVRPRSVDVSGDIQSLKVEISSTTYYLAEVVRQMDEDAWVSDEGVLIYKVDGPVTGEPCTDMHSPTDTLWQTNQTFEDTTHDITIAIMEEIGDAWRIIVSNNAGSPDPRIIDWGDPEGQPPPYETVDIWVDSPLNGWDFYRHRDSSGNPTGNGDEPWANHENRLCARIRNIGQAIAYDVTVNFKFRYPISTGNPDWIDVDTYTISSLAPGTSQEIYVLWTPEVDVDPDQSGSVYVHGCVRVEIEEYTGELSTANNHAQENIGYFEVVGGSGAGMVAQVTSPFLPVTMVFNIGNPLEEATRIYLNLVDISAGWTPSDLNSVVGFHNFSSLEVRQFSIEMVPDSGIDYGTELGASIMMGFVSEEDGIGDFVGDLHLEPYGGLTYWARTMYNGTISMTSTVVADTITVTGRLSSTDGLPTNLFPTDDRYILLELTNDGTGNVTYHLVTTDSTGDFSYSFANLEYGTYSASAYYGGSDILSSAFGASPPVTVGGFVIPFELLVIGGVVLLLIIVVIIFRRR